MAIRRSQAVPEIQKSLSISNTICHRFKVFGGGRRQRPHERELMKAKAKRARIT